MANLSNINNKFLVTTGGNVGINTTSPTSKLDVREDANNVYTAYFYNSDTNSNSNGINVQTATTNASAYAFRVNSGSNSNALVVKGNANVGIGTASPSANLEIAGDVLINSGEYISWGGVGETSIEGSTASNKIQFRTGSGDRMIINNTGVGIGTTSPSGVLHIKKDNALATFEIQGGLNTQTTAGAVNGEINFGVNDPSTTGGIGASIKNISQISNGAHNGLAFYTGLQSRTPYLQQMLYFTAQGGVSFGTSNLAYGTSGQILKSNADAPPSWVDASTVIGGPYLPLSAGSGDPLTGDLYINKSAPALRLNDSGSNKPYELRVDAETFSIKEVSNSRTLMSMTTGAVITLDSLGSNTVINTTGAMVVPNGKVGIGTTSPDAILNISKTSFSTTFTSADSYIRIGKGENATNGYQFIGFGYNNGSADLVPAYIGYQQTGTPGNYTKGDLVFGTRNVTTNTIPTERMRINATGNVLIGNPSVDHAYKLQIEGNDIMLNTENSIQGKSIYARYSSQFTIQCDSELRFSTGGSPTQKMVIQAGGNVGIGVTSPTGAKLEVKKDHGDTWVADFHNISADYQGVRIRQDSTSGSGGPGASGNSALVVDDQRANNMVTPTPTVYIKRSGANTNGLLLSVEPHAVTGLTVNDLGRVGIGTEAPDAQLEVETASYAATNAVANFINGNNPTRVAYDTVVVAQTDVASLSLVETPAGGQSVEQKLTFAVGDTNAVIRTANTSGGMWFNVNASVSASAYLTTSGTNAIRILNSGNVGILDSTPSYELDVDGTIRATGDIIAYSDVRVKENIKTIDNSLEKVSKLRGVEFNKIGKDEKSIGVIAQEIEKVIPEVVREDEKGMKSVAYGNISGLLIEAIKELKAEIDELKKHSCDCKK